MSLVKVAYTRVDLYEVARSCELVSCDSTVFQRQETKCEMRLHRNIGTVTSSTDSHQVLAMNSEPELSPQPLNWLRTPTGETPSAPERRLPNN